MSEGIVIRSLLDRETRAPMVMVEWGQMRGGFKPNEARNLGLSLLEAAQGAELDAFLVEFALTHLKMPEDLAGKLLRDFRNYLLIREEITG